jgi:3-dehydroquinate synthase
MLRIGADRHSICINLGGGVIGDMGGWTAASFMRGMAFIQVPTTLLSMVDASVGGKLGIDFQGVKNIIGLIKDPNAVFIFTEFLETLTTQLIRSGFAEVIKHGLIQDQKYFDKVKTIDLKTFKEWDEIVYESVMIKKAVTEVDPYEKGIRKILNFGHTIGHAIESLSFNHKTPLLHGEAIAIGLITEAHLSYQQKFITEQELNAVTHFLTSLYGIHPEYIPEASEILPLMLKDKKNKGGRIKFSIPNKIGQCLYDQEVTLEQIEEALRYYTSL